MLSRVITCYHVLSLVIICYNLLSLVSYHLLSLVIICYHMLSRVITCYHLLSLVITCCHLLSLVVTCDHLLSRVITAMLSPFKDNFSWEDMMVIVLWDQLGNVVPVQGQKVPLTDANEHWRHELDDWRALLAPFSWKNSRASVMSSNLRLWIGGVSLLSFHIFPQSDRKPVMILIAFDVIISIQFL